MGGGGRERERDCEVLSINIQKQLDEFPTHYW